MHRTLKPVYWLAQFVVSSTHHLPAALMVTAVVTFCHHNLHLLDAVDGYAFLGIGNFAARSISHEVGRQAEVGVILIDDAANENYYRQRSPLGRCELEKDLRAIYDLYPQLLVIDLDLSPALLDDPYDPAHSENDGALMRCEEKLLGLLMQHRDATQTVLIAPLAMVDKIGKKGQDDWRTKLEPYVTFANDPTISIKYGMANEIECNRDSLAATAFEKYPHKYDRYPRKVGVPRDCLDENVTGENKAKLTINPGHYFSGLLPVSVSKLPSRCTDTKTCQPLNRALRLPVLFLGASFGDNDTFLTPLGTMYGVDVHAAAFMSLLQPTTHDKVVAFFLDVLIGLAMGGTIAWCWQRYFNLRFSASAAERQAAPWLILVVSFLMIVALLLLTWASFVLLRTWNIWLSPIPIAIGMLFESFFNSAVSAAVGEGYEQRQALVRRLEAAHADGPERFSTQLKEELKQHPHPAHAIPERLARFFYLDFERLRRSQQYYALALLLIRRGTFCALLVWLLLLA
jgi:hypothetical protein